MTSDGKGSALGGLQLSERINRALVDHLGEAIHVIDENWRVIYANEAMESWLLSIGFDDLPIQGRLLAEVFAFLGPGGARRVPPMSSPPAPPC